MSLTFELAMAPRLGLEVSPALVAFGEMLMLPHAELQCLVEDELSANAALERQEPGDCPLCRGAGRRRCTACAEPLRGPGPDRHQRAAEVPDTEPDIEVLRRSVHAETSAADAALVDYLIDSLDRRGLFDRTCAELAAEAGTTAEHVASLVDVIRQCGSPGVGATTIAECLLLQLDALGLPDDRLVRALITGHLEALARGHFASIADALAVGREDVQRALEVIRLRLRPYPAFDGPASAAPAYVVPDVVIVADPDAAGFRIELVEAATTQLRVRAGEPGSRAARMFLTQLHDRWETLRRVVEHVATHQRAFLTGGPLRLRPLTRAEVAAALGLHESTVSRAVAHKYVLLPTRTTMPLSSFFGSGGADEALRRLLASERGRLSDQQLAGLMCDAGYPMARRTVAKHRARLGFMSASLR